MLRGPNQENACRAAVRGESFNVYAGSDRLAG